MIRRVVLVWVMSILLLSSAAICQAQQPPVVSVLINTKPLSFDVPPQNMDGRVMLPVRAIVEALGGSVDWIAETRTVIVYKFSDLDAMALQIDSLEYFTLSSGLENPFYFDKSPVIVDGRTLVPVRLIAEFMGVQPYWDQQTQTVLLVGEVFSGTKNVLLAHESFASMFGLQPEVRIQPHPEGLTPILGRPQVSAQAAARWAESRGATAEFVALAELYWSLATRDGARPDVAYAQAAKETGYGRFGGAVDASFMNPCGLKTTNAGDGTCEIGSAYHRFASWEEGVLAHLHHLDLYAGVDATPYEDTPDPRHFGYLKGKVQYVEHLGGTWAMNPVYGFEIVENLLNKMIEFEQSLSAK